MELNSYFSKFLFDLYNVNCSDFIIDDENQFSIHQKPSITIIQNKNELIYNNNCDNCLLGCLDLNTGNSIIYQKTIDQVSNRYFIKMKQVKDLVTGEVVVIGETQGSAMTAEPTGMSLEEIQEMFLLITKLKLLIYANLNWSCKVRSVELQYFANIRSIESSVISIVLSLVQSNSKLLSAFEWLINLDNQNIVILEHPYWFYVNLVEMIKRESKNTEMWIDISKDIFLGYESLDEFCSRIKNNDEIQSILKSYFKLRNCSDKIFIYENYFNPDNTKVFKNQYVAAELGLNCD